MYRRYRDPQPKLRWCSENIPQERKEELQETECLKIPQVHDPQNQLSRVHNDLQRQKQQLWSLYRFALGPLYKCMFVQFGVLVRLKTVGMWGVPESFAYTQDPFPPIELPHPALIKGYVPSVFYKLLCCIIPNIPGRLYVF